MKTNTRNPRQKTRKGLRQLTVLGATLAVLVTGACGAADTTKPAADGAAKTTAPLAVAPAVLDDDAYLENASAYVDAAKDTWDATVTKVKVELGEDGATMYFKPKDLVLEAGKPYEIEMVNTGKVKHEFTADKFFRSAAVRKVDNASSEVKAPFFSEIEVMAGKTVKLFVIPVIPGSFETLCEIEGHREAGMEGTITVTGAKPTAPVEVLGSVKAGAWLQDGKARIEAASATWDAKAVKASIEAGEDGAAMFFKPKDLVLKVDVPVQLTLINSGKTKHEWSSDTFFPTMALRKAEDEFGEYKTPLLDEAEVKVGGKLDLFLIPTKVGKYKIVCAIPGHEAAGMVGTVTVTK